MTETGGTGSLKSFLHTAPVFCSFNGPIFRVMRCLEDVCTWLVQRGYCEDLTGVDKAVAITVPDPYTSALSTADVLEERLRAVQHDIAAMEERIERMARI